MHEKRIALFDVDGTVTNHRETITEEMSDFLINLHNVIDIGFVGGASHETHVRQVGNKLLSVAEYCFSENGASAYKHNELYHRSSLSDFINNDTYNKYISFILRLLSEQDLPFKTGTFVEYRTCMLNICPIGRNATKEQRDLFEQYDKEHHIRSNMIEQLKAHFPNLKLTYLIGGQTSFDILPEGMDKTYCLQFLNEYDDIYFFGDKIQPGGNDCAIFNHPSTKGYHVTSYKNTKELCTTLFLSDQ